MDLLKKCLIEFNNQWTNKITEKEVDDDKQLRFTLLDMQKFAKKYVEAINVIQCCKTLKIEYIPDFENWLKENKYIHHSDNYYVSEDNNIWTVNALAEMYVKETNL